MGGSDGGGVVGGGGVVAVVVMVLTMVHIPIELFSWGTECSIDSGRTAANDIMRQAIASSQYDSGRRGAATSCPTVAHKYSSKIPVMQMS